MNHQQHAEDPEPSERIPAGPLFVPVRPGPTGYVTRLFRTPLGSRTAVGFTTEQRLAAALGPEQAWVRLAEPALRALAEPLGAATLTVDPQLVAPAVRPVPAPAPALTPAPARRHRRLGEWDPQAVGALRVAGATAVVSCLSMWIG
ncbi:SAV_915 family protein [Peterkaempfera sp. SMS 1(5)a]|uniref:SAV_915 family protein n=1 Tax=Peterkaempfera podocarpi TaxID=3232308 RepID=UPI00366BF37A